MIYGYVRVSTKEQHIDRQMKSLIDFGVPEANIKVDKESGKDFDRPAYQLLRNEILRTGDVLVVKELLPAPSTPSTVINFPRSMIIKVLGF